LPTGTKSQEQVFFGEFALDCRTGELRRNGVPVKLQPQPAKVLNILVKRAGDVVSRTELAQQVWGTETYVDFEHGLNFAIRQIRTVLEDSADHPKFLETLPKRGYRFIGQVKDSPPAATLAQAKAPVGAYGRPRNPFLQYALALATILLGSTVIFVVVYLFRSQRAPLSSAASLPIRSVAVLPLHNLSADSEQEYFSDGMTDELITELVKVGSLKVISHTSVERYKGTKQALSEIGRELGVDAVIEGSVLRSGDRVRITAQLIDVRTDQHVWADSYERDFKNIVALQGEVAERIAREVGINPGPEERARLTKNRTLDPAAHEALLKGDFYWNKLTCSSFEKALGFYQDAASRDPKLADAYAGIADSYFNLADWRCRPLDDAFRSAKAAARHTVELDPNSAEGHASLGELAFYHDWDWPTAKQEFVKAIGLDGSIAGIHSAYGIFLVSMGRNEEAFSETRKSLELDPVSEESNLTSIYVLYLAHRYDEAISQAKKTLELYPNSGAIYYWLAQCYEQKMMWAEALEAYLKCRSDVAINGAILQTAYQRNGMPGYWEEDLRIRKRLHKGTDPVIEAMAYGHARQKEKTLEALKRAYQQHCDGLQFLKVEPVYDGIREDPRYKELVSALQL